MEGRRYSGLWGGFVGLWQLSQESSKRVEGFGTALAGSFTGPRAMDAPRSHPLRHMNVEFTAYRVRKELELRDLDPQITRVENLDRGDDAVRLDTGLEDPNDPGVLSAAGVW